MCFFIALGWRQLPNVELGDALKGASPGIGVGVHGCLYVISGLQCVGKCDAWIKERWQHSVILASMGGMLG